MEQQVQNKGQLGLKNKVVNQYLCTNCGACVELCPYQLPHKDHVTSIFDCNLETGRCYSYCPRTETNLDSLQGNLFDKKDVTPEVGAVKGFYVTCAKDESVRKNGQHGGTVTTLMALALKEGLIDSAIMNEGGSGGLLPSVVEVKDPSRALTLGKSSFIASPTVSWFNRIANKTDAKNIGIVALPCQALSLAKMRQKPIAQNDNNIDKLKLVVGLFCGWTLSLDRLYDLLSAKMNVSEITWMDIPPSKYQILEVHTKNGSKIDVPLDEVNRCVRGNCNFCFDMTAEFSDVSVGSARLPEGWDVAKKWNQVIVRTTKGQELIELAKKKGVLEFHEVPEGNLDRLKKASMGKKQTAVKNLRLKSKSQDDLMYLDCKDPALKSVM